MGKIKILCKKRHIWKCVELLRTIIFPKYKLQYYLEKFLGKVKERNFYYGIKIKKRYES